jgi:hypothetical protein
MDYQTDKEICDDCDKLLKECFTWAINNFPKHTEETQRTLGITRFLYLKDKLFNHSPRYYRDKELATKGKGGTAEIKNA